MRTLVSVFFLMCSILGYADTMNVTVDPSNPQFQVTLPANPTTGFQWTVQQYDKSLLQLTDSKYLAPQTKLIGAGGEMVFTFKLVPAETYPEGTQIDFLYARSWEPKTGTAQQVTVQFKKSTPSK